MNQLWGKQGQLTTGNSTGHNNFGQLLSLLKGLLQSGQRRK